MFCQECGKPADAGIRYCPHCGANVAGQETEPAAAGQYAEFGPRMAACLTDWLIQLTAGGVLPVLLAPLVVPLFEYDGLVGQLTGFVIVFLSMGVFLYEPLLTSSRWQATLGKRALGIIVTDENGGRISFTRATGRWFAKSLSGLVLPFIVYLLQPFTPKKQALHDMLAGTLVVKR